MARAGKTYFITGGASGLGLATVRRLHAEGANVVIVDKVSLCLHNLSSPSYFLFTVRELAFQTLPKYVVVYPARYNKFRFHRTPKTAPRLQNNLGTVPYSAK